MSSVVPTTAVASVRTAAACWSTRIGSAPVRCSESRRSPVAPNASRTAFTASRPALPPPAVEAAKRTWAEYACSSTETAPPPMETTSGDRRARSSIALIADRSAGVSTPAVSVATSTPVAPLGARNGAANLAARTLGASAGRNDAVSLRTTLASEGSSTTEATVADTQNATTGQRYRTTARNIAESTRETLRAASRGDSAACGFAGYRKEG